MASIRDDGKTHLELVDTVNRLVRITPRLQQPQRKYHPEAIVVDVQSATGSLLPELKANRVRTLQISGRDYARVRGQFYDAVCEKTLMYLDDPLLNEAIEAGCMKPVGDPLWRQARKDITTDISPLVAVTLAVWGLQRGEMKRIFKENRGEVRIWWNIPVKPPCNS